MVESGQFQGRVVVLSGGGSGIGQATAVQFADSGAYVLITGRREALLQQTALRHPHIVPVVADVSQAESCNQVISRAMELWGRLDILVNNAGVFRSRSLAEVSEKTFHDLFDINVLGPTLLARAALPHLIQTQGVIINVSSSYSTKPSPGAAHYAASKAALNHLTQSWALELAPHHIRVNAIAPGPTETPILEHAGLSSSTIATVIEGQGKRNPLGRRGRPEEMAEWILFLASPRTSWMTGQIITVDGGDSLE